jgi:cleavage stimulation factor subunit 2
MASASLSAVPPHLQAQYRTTTPPVSQTSMYGSYSQANGQDSSSHPYTSTPPNMINHHEYEQQQSGYAGQYQQQPSSYPGYPPTYSGQTASHQTPTPASSSNLTDALASIPDDQKVRIYVFQALGVKKSQVVCDQLSLIFYLIFYFVGTHYACAVYDT